MKLWKRDFPGELNTWKMVEILTPKWTSKKAFLKTPRGPLLVSLRKISPSRQMLRPWNLFVTTRAFQQWLLECHQTSQKFSAAGNPNFFVFHKKLRGRLQNALSGTRLGLSTATLYCGPRACRNVYMCRMNMIETLLESSCVPHSENIYIVGFGNSRETRF